MSTKHLLINITLLLGSLFTVQVNAEIESELPRAAIPAIREGSSREPFLKFHKTLTNKILKRRPWEIVFLGDSITRGWKIPGAKEMYAEYFGENALNLGFSGDATENLLWRIQNGQVDGINPKLVIILIGTNNTGLRKDPANETAMGIRAILDTVQNKLPETKILLLAIYPRGESPSDPMRKTNDEINKIIQNYADEKRVYWLDINPIFLDSNGRISKEIMNDFLHPNPETYKIIAEALNPTVKELIAEE